MLDDRDELRYEQAVERKTPEVVIAAIEEIEVHLRYGLPRLNLALWVIVALLALILWRI